MKKAAKEITHNSLDTSLRAVNLASLTHLHERQAERVPAASQQSLALCHRLVIKSNTVYLGSRKRCWK